jgi:hypothetical protein
MGSGIRLVGADAANSSVTRTNIVDNAYGVFNAAADGTSDAANPLSAENNWWGLWSPVQPPAQESPPNDGPEVSPATNPPYPENPVNGSPTAEGSSTVDFRPYRDGPQSDPNRGQFPVVPAPIPVNDEAPSITVAPERAQYRRGETVKLIAVPSDDFGIRRVTFFDGSAEVGSDESPPYEGTFTVPADAPCGSVRPVAATAEDSLGQTATATSSLQVVCDTGTGPGGGGPGGVLEPPTVKLPDNLRFVRRTGTTVTVRPRASQGVAHVDFFLGARRVCRDTRAPYRCRIVPFAREIGSQTVRAVVTDNAGLTGQDARQVVVPKFRPRALLVDVVRTQLPGNQVRKTLVARVLPTLGVSRAKACANGRVTAVLRRGLITLRDVQVKLNRRCRAVITRFTAPHNQSRRFIYKVSARFGGTTVMVPARKTRRFS